MGLKSLLHGRRAEEIAASYLRRRGYKILEKNKRYKCGEIDIIATDKVNHVFVEVKFRGSNSHGTASEMISVSKKTKLVKAAKIWLQENDPHFSLSCRFDVIAISREANSNSNNIEWLQNAFTPELW